MVQTSMPNVSENSNENENGGKVCRGMKDEK
jgi:hypothetical protein